MILDWIRRLLFKPKKYGGLVPSSPDSRDFKYRKSGDTIKNIDLSMLTGPVLYQGKSNACVSFAVCELLDYVLEYKRKGVTWKNFKSSKLFLWYMARLEEGSELENSGVVLRNAFKVIQKKGFLLDVQYPFNMSKWYKMPDADTLMKAEFFKLYVQTIPKYYRISTAYNFERNISNCLSNNVPVIFGFPIVEQLDKANKTNYEVNEAKGFRGYHAMLITGETDTHYIVKNSWGTRWGNKGYCHIKKDLMRENALDVWTLR